MATLNENTYNTNNAVGSNSAEDASDNARSFDAMVNGSASDSVQFRLGKVLPTIASMAQSAKEAYQSANEDIKGTYSLGVVYEKLNDVYLYDDALFGVISTVTLPYTATQADPNNDPNLMIRGISKNYVDERAPFIPWSSGLNSIKNQIYIYSENSETPLYVYDTVGGNTLGDSPDMSVFTVYLSKNTNTVNVMDFGATGDGVTDDTGSINLAMQHAYDLGGGAVFFPRGRYVIKETLKLKTYCKLDYYTGSNRENYTGISIVGDGAQATHLLWLGGQNGDGDYGTCISATAESRNDGAVTGETSFRGTISDIHITIPNKQYGHAGGWPITNRFTTIASPSAGVDFPNLATYPTEISKDGSENNLAACAIYMRSQAPANVVRVHIDYFCYGIWAGIGYSTTYETIFIRWTNCAYAFDDAITTTLLKDSQFERNAVGIIFRTAQACTVQGCVSQANYAGCDVLFHSWNQRCVLRENYFEASPKSVVIRTDSGGDYRNAGHIIENNFGLGLDIDTQSIDNLFVRENLIRIHNGNPDTLFNNLLGQDLQQRSNIYVSDNVIRLTGSPDEEIYGLFTEWEGNDTARIVERDSIVASESITTNKYYGRESEMKIGGLIAATTELFELTVGNPPASNSYSGIVEVVVRKSYAQNNTSPISVSTSTYKIGYSRVSGSEVLFSRTDISNEYIDINGTDTSLSAIGQISITTGGATADENKITISESGRTGGNTAQVYVSVKHIAMTGNAFIRKLNFQTLV